MRHQAIIGGLLIVAVGVVLGATVFRTDIAQATGLSPSVTVANTASNPVPVLEQNVDGKNIRVHEEGTANVNVSGTASTRSADNPAFQPVRLVTGGLCGSNDQCDNGPGFTVPAGKTLVVEFASLYALLPLGQNAKFTLIDDGGGPDLSQFADVIPDEQAGAVHVANQTMRAYLDSGHTLEITVEQFGATGSGRWHAEISGYLVDTP
jgi:hypothetical protein